MSEFYRAVLLAAASAILAACATSLVADDTPAPGTVAVHMGGKMSFFGGAGSAR